MLLQTNALLGPKCEIQLGKVVFGLVQNVLEGTKDNLDGFKINWTGPKSI